jgi:hypothetical protein
MTLSDGDYIQTPKIAKLFFSLSQAIKAPVNLLKQVTGAFFVHVLARISHKIIL